MHGRVLVIAGSDSGGGAGIQADIKSITALGAFATTAITALTAQNTMGVHAVHPVPPDFIRAQIRAILDDLGADAIKTGMLGDSATIEAVRAELDSVSRRTPLVLDPVMTAKGGARLLADSAITALRTRLIPRAAVLTPNLPEAEALLGHPIETESAMRQAALDLLALGPRAVLLKGGHLPGDDLLDLLVTRDTTLEFRARRIPTRHTHGTGCTLASALAAGLAQGLTLPDATARARAYVRAAIESAPGLGQGHGPLDHAVTFDSAKLAATH